MARRIETINRTSREIISGDLSRRMPLQGTNDELDRRPVGLNQMLDRIQALMEDVRRVSDNIAHDLRTPLGWLHNKLDSLRGELQSAGIDTTSVEQALSESEGLLATFNALLRIARIEGRAAQRGFRAARSGRAGARCGRILRTAGRGAARHWRWTPHRACNSAAIVTCCFRLWPTCWTMRSNTPRRGGHIGVTLTTTGPGEARLVIADSGPGIPPAARAQVFQRFFRLGTVVQHPAAALG